VIDGIALDDDTTPPSVSTFSETAAVAN
jgi:hypothetical protein